MEAFYAADERRRRSPELDFGCWWYGGPTRQKPHRLTWVEDTGELILIKLNSPEHVTVLGVVTGRAQIEAVLAGWAEVCGQLDSVTWIHQRVPAVPVTIQPNRRKD